MPKFRKKPVVVEAVQFTGENREEVLRFMDGERAGGGGSGTGLVIETLEGLLQVSPGDWIIRGVKGEFYPCKPGIFEATYDPVEESLDGG